MAGGYASRNAYDWESLLSKGVLAARLMRTTYADLFPEEYVRRFEAHWTYGAFVSGGRSMRRQQQQTLSEVTTAMLQDTSGVDRTFVRVMYAIGTAQAALWRSYAMLRFGAWKWWLRGRLSVAVNLKRLALIDRFDF
jgi:hypothetical protein